MLETRKMCGVQPFNRTIGFFNSKVIGSVFERKSIIAVIIMLSILANVTVFVGTTNAAELVDKNNSILLSKKDDIQYTLNFSEESPKAVQNYYVGTGYLYTTQRYEFSGKNYIKITKFSMKNNKPVKEHPDDEMWVENAGHGQTLEVYDHICDNVKHT